MAPDRGAEARIAEIDSTTLPISLNNLTLENDTLPAIQTPTPTEETQAIPPHLSHDPLTNAKRTDPFQFGQRYLSEKDDIFAYNAWDHVVPDDDHLAFAQEQYAKQRAAPVSSFDYKRFNEQPEKWWDLFYKQKTSTFFKDRKWLVQEFPVLAEVTGADAGEKVVLEVGAGAGNTAFPVMRINRNAGLRLWAVDFSKRAVETMRNAEDYATIQEGRDGRVGSMRAEVWDVAGEDLPEGMQEGMADVVIMIFVFSALSPEQWKRAVRNVWRCLKPGGEVLFRDYGRGDLAQVRFKSGRWMAENFYVRGDGTRVYFFEREELGRIWGGEGWVSGDEDVAKACGSQDGNEDVQQSNPRSEDPGEMLEPNTNSELGKIWDPKTEARYGKIQERSSKVQDDVMVDVPRFSILNLDVDRRMIVNRQRRIKMYRCWLQGRFCKPLSS